MALWTKWSPHGKMADGERRAPTGLASIDARRLLAPLVSIA
jgi:hypothetical protein